VGEQSATKIENRLAKEEDTKKLYTIGYGEKNVLKWEGKTLSKMYSIS
jgi:hypothetical protein